MYWIIGKLFSNSLPASCSVTHKRVDAENIGFLHHSIDLDTLIEQEDLSNNPFVHLYMPDMYIFYWVCSGYCNRHKCRLTASAHAAAEGGDGDIEDGKGTGAGCEGNAGAGGEDDKDDNGPAAANEDDDAGEASGADSAKTPGAKKAAAVTGLPQCLALLVHSIRVWPGPTDSESHLESCRPDIPTYTCIYRHISV